MFYLSDKIDWVNYKASPKKEEKKSESNQVSIDDNELRELKRMNEKLMAAYKKLTKEKEVYM
jgi:mannose/fructose/N-acetylgalactosamine-specific phosphotransferase system component IIB